MTSDSQTVVSGSKDSSVHIVNVNSGQVGVPYSSIWSLFFLSSPFLPFWSIIGVFSGCWLINRSHQFHWVCWYLVKVVSQISWQMATQFCYRMWLSCLQLWLGSYREHGSKADHLGPHAPIQPMHLRTWCGSIASSLCVHLQFVRSIIHPFFCACIDAGGRDITGMARFVKVRCVRMHWRQGAHLGQPLWGLRQGVQWACRCSTVAGHHCRRQHHGLRLIRWLRPCVWHLHVQVKETGTE